MSAALALVLYRLTGEKVDVLRLLRMQLGPDVATVGWIVVIFGSLGLLVPLVAIVCGF